MKKLVPVAVLIIGAFIYVYVYHILPNRKTDPTVRGAGTIEAFEVDVSARLTARITSVHAAEGDSVKKGDVLFMLDCADLEAKRDQAIIQVEQAQLGAAQAEAMVVQAMAVGRQQKSTLSPYTVTMEYAETELARAKRLKDSEVISGKMVDDALAQQRTAVEQLKVVQSGVDVAHKGVGVARRGFDMAKVQVDLAKSAVASIEVQLQECTVKSPLNGVVISRNYEEGETIFPGASVFRLGRLQEVYTRIYVANEEVGRLRLGNRVRLTADTYPGRTFLGRIVHINPDAEFTPKSIQTKEDRTRLVFGVKVVVDNLDNALLPGMPVEARVLEGSETTAADRRTQNNR